jgi:uncharacterized membrane protein
MPGVFGVQHFRVISRLAEVVFVESPLPYAMRCHQRSDRSFFVNGRQFHVCARCTGLLCGVVLSPSFWFVGRADIALFVACLTVLVLDGATQAIGVRRSTNALRFITGALLSATFFAIMPASTIGTDEAVRYPPVRGGCSGPTAKIKRAECARVFRVARDQRVDRTGAYARRSSMLFSVDLPSARLCGRTDAKCRRRNDRTRGAWIACLSCRAPARVAAL